MFHHVFAEVVIQVFFTKKSLEDVTNDRPRNFFAPLSPCRKINSEVNTPVIDSNVVLQITDQEYLLYLVDATWAV